MDYGIDAVSVETVGDVICRGDITFVETEIWATIQHLRVVQGGAIIELVKGDEFVIVLIGDSEGSNDPRTSVVSINIGYPFSPNE